MTEYKLKDLCLIEITDGTHKTPIYSEQGYMFLSSKNVTSGRIDWDNPMYIPEWLHQELYKRIAPKKDDILLAKNGTTGIAAIVDRDEIFDIYVSLALIRPDKEKVLPKYLLYAINSDSSKRYFDSHLKGIGVPNLHLTHIRETPIKIPSKNTQEEIVAILDRLSDFIELYNQQLSKLDELVKSRFIEMFGDPMLNTKGFQLVPYGSLFELNAGGTPSKKESKYWDGGTISWIGSNMCQNEIIYQNDGKYITEDGYNNSSARMFPIDTVLIALVGATIGKTALLKFETTTNQNVLGIRKIAESYNNPYFVFYYTQGIYNKFLEIGDGGFSMASKDFVSKLPFPIVPIDLQNQFAEFVEQTDKLKSEIKESLEKIETLKKSLMQKYFG